MPRKPVATPDNVLAFVTNFIQKNGYSPTYREIGEVIGTKNTYRITECLDILEDEGKIERVGRIRTIRLVEKEDK